MDDALNTSPAAAPAFSPSVATTSESPRSPQGAEAGTGADEDEAGEVDLMAALRRMIDEQRAADAARTPSAPFVCGDARLGGGHNYRVAYKCWDGTHLVCECGARAREGVEGQLFADTGFGPPPAPPAAASAKEAA